MFYNLHKFATFGDGSKTQRESDDQLLRYDNELNENIITHTISKNDIFFSVSNTFGNLWVSVILSIGFIVTTLSMIYITINGDNHNTNNNLIEIYTSLNCNDSCCVFCNSPMSDIIQSFNFYGDSKYFVDMPLKEHPATVMNAFNFEIILQNLTKNGTAIQAFIDKYFDEPGSDISECLPIDYNTGIGHIPKSLRKVINDANLREFTRLIYPLWKDLCRTIDDSVYEYPERHSLIPLEYPQMMISGGRFREIYYWDSLWIIKGLLVCNMTTSAKQTMENIMQLSAKFNHTINGNRLYYQNRSQPPLLALMVDLIYKYENKNDSWIKQNSEYIYIIKKDYEWWMKDQSVTINNFTLNLYKIDSDEPRPEGYVEDTSLINELQNQSLASRRSVLSSIRAGAEAGWDFSSRWCTDHFCKKDMINIDTIHIIPVELNAYFYQIECLLSKFFNIIGNQEQSQYFNQKSIERLNAIHAILWDKESLIWRDWDLRRNKFVNQTSLSNYIPLWVIPYNLSLANIVLTNLNNSGLVRWGGIATTLITDGQQWDWPNAWPPIQYIIAEACKRYRTASPLAAYLELNVTQTFISAAYTGWYDPGPTGKYMHEKYNVEQLGATGIGGEYTPQTGFGWTNAVAFSFLHDYGDVLYAPQLPWQSNN